MRVFFLSDLHLFHANIIKYCSRPFCSADEMNEECVRRWNATVSPNDVVIFVGDLSAGLGNKKDEFRSLIKTLNGTKLLVRGNHDHQSDVWYVESGFVKVFESLRLGKVMFVHYPIHEAINLGYVSIDEVKDFDHVIHGHVHRSDTPNFDDHFNVAADRNNFTPVSYDVAVPFEFHEGMLEGLKKLLNEHKIVL